MMEREEREYKSWTLLDVPYKTFEHISQRLYSNTRLALATDDWLVYSLLIRQTDRQTTNEMKALKTDRQTDSICQMETKDNQLQLQQERKRELH